MSNIATLNLSEVANAINSVAERAQALYVSGADLIREALTCDKEAGDLLIKVKASMPKGNFHAWIEANCRFSVRHAQRLMMIAREWTKIMKGWEDLQQHDTRVVLGDSLLPSLRTALTLAASEPKEEAPKPTHYKVAQPNHTSYGEVVEAVKELHNGDVVVCKTPRGEFPFLKKELVAQDAPLQTEPEIIDVEIIDESEKLREAIAISIEYFPATVLKAILAQTLFIGRDYLPEGAKSSASKLIAGSEMGTLVLT